MAALLYVRPDKLLAVLLEHRVDFVENVVHVFGQLLVSFLDVGDLGLLDLLRLLGAARCALLTAVVASHQGTSGARSQSESLSRQYLSAPTKETMNAWIWTVWPKTSTATAPYRRAQQETKT